MSRPRPTRTRTTANLGLMVECLVENPVMIQVAICTGSRIASQLEEMGEIRREETVHNGNRTYLLRPAKKDLDFSLLMAGEMLSPLVGDDEKTDPIESDEFTGWVLRLTQTQ